MVVRTQAENIIDGIRPIVRRAEGADVSPFGVRAGRCVESVTTNLAAIVVQRLHRVNTISVSDDPLNGRLPSYWLNWGSCRLTAPRGMLRIVSYESESPNHVS